MASVKITADSGGGSTALAAPSSTTSNAALTWKLPVADGSANQLLKTDGSGNLGWATNNRSHKNLIINGAMQVVQRNGGSVTADGYQTIDRWTLGSGGTDEGCTQKATSLGSSDTGPFEKGFRTAYQIKNGNQTSGAGAADYIEIYQYIEDQDICQSGWDYTSSSSKLTLSFWVKSSVAQKFYGFLYTNQAGAGDCKMYSYVIDNGSGGNLTADTWTKITHTIPGDSNLTFNVDNTNGLAVGIYPFQGTDYTTSGHSLNTWAAWSSSNKVPDMTSTWYTTNDAEFEITGVQLEVGSVATPFSHRSYGDDLAKCQRYYQTVPDSVLSSGYGTDSGYSRGSHIYVQTMRTSPTLTITETSSGSVLAQATSKDGFYVTFNGLSETGASLFNFIASAEI